jgi:hypothetical protein
MLHFTPDVSQFSGVIFSPADIAVDKIKTLAAVIYDRYEMHDRHMKTRVIFKIPQKHMQPGNIRVQRSPGFPDIVRIKSFHLNIRYAHDMILLTILPGLLIKIQQ